MNRFASKVYAESFYQSFRSRRLEKPLDSTAWVLCLRLNFGLFKTILRLSARRRSHRLVVDTLHLVPSNWTIAFLAIVSNSLLPHLRSLVLLLAIQKPLEVAINILFVGWLNFKPIISKLSQLQTPELSFCPSLISLLILWHCWVPKRNLTWHYACITSGIVFITQSLENINFYGVIYTLHFGWQ